MFSIENLNSSIFDNSILIRVSGVDFIQGISIMVSDIYSNLGSTPLTEGPSVNLIYQIEVNFFIFQN